MSTPKGVGQPLKFKSAEALQKKIDGYFSKCDDKEKPYTISGLAYALNSCRQTLLNYAERDEYLDTVKRAKLKIEAYAEESLFIARNTNGIMFNLKNNFGWNFCIWD